MLREPVEFALALARPSFARTAAVPGPPPRKSVVKGVDVVATRVEALGGGARALSAAAPVGRGAGRKRVAWALAGLTPALAWWAAAGPASGQERHVLDSRVASVYNLAGTVEVVPGTGSGVVVEVARGGADADELRIETGTARGRESLRVRYPGDRVVYRGGGGSAAVRVRDDGTFFGRGGGGRHVDVSRRGRGLEAHADLIVRVPPGGDVAVYVGVGHASARGVEGRLLVELRAGRVRVTDVEGDVNLDTGSGAVSVANVDGSVRVDTGSGGVSLDAVTGRAVDVDTGSGAVEGRDVSAETLRVDTGSGRIRFDGLAASRVECDTGSGAVHLSLASDVERLLVDTGSGGVTLVAPSELGAELRLNTGSGRISVDAPGALVDVSGRGYLRGTLGDGVGRVVVDTGSGNVKVRGK